MTWKLIQGDCLEVLRNAPDESVDAVVTDPPAGIGFMGKDWDDYRRSHNPADVGRDNVFGRASRVAPEVGRARDGFIAMLGPIMVECLRVLKPGGHAVVWALPRTSHWTATAIEDAGFEIRDVIHHVFGTGFPKSMDVSKAIDKQAGAEREVVGLKPSNRPNVIGQRPGGSMDGGNITERVETAPATPEAAEWAGWGTALKPAAENWIIARKPLSEPTVAANVLKHGTSAINVDGCRVRRESGDRTEYGVDGDEGNPRPNVFGDANRVGYEPHDAGRWPANLVLSHAPECRRVGDRKVKTGTAYEPEKGIPAESMWGAEQGDGLRRLGRECTYGGEDGTETVAAYECAEGCPVAELDGQSGELKTNAGRGQRNPRTTQSDYGNFNGGETAASVGSSGGASRFFNTFQPDSLDDVAPFFYSAKASRAERGKDNKHPTVKPIKLMRHLVRLVTPPGGTVLDPFTGSGTTGVAALRESFSFIGIEREEEYCTTIRARLQAEQPQEPVRKGMKRPG